MEKVIRIGVIIWWDGYEKLIEEVK